jgi:hypothetical protein
MLLPGTDPDSQFFGNPAKLLSVRPRVAGERLPAIFPCWCFPLSLFLIACKWLKWEKNQVAPGADAGISDAAL